MAKDELAVAQEPERYTPMQSWDDLTQDADVVLGNDLLKDELLDALVGVPFIIHRVTFQDAKIKSRKSFVSCEAVIAPTHELERRRVDLKTLPFDAEDQVVFNDGSTGIYRQIVAYLAGKGFITLPEPIKIEGKMGESSFDLSPDEWADIKAGDLRYTPNGVGLYVANVRIYCKRGIRVSDYVSEWNPDSKTRYLA